MRPPATSSSSSAPHPPHPECNGEAKKKKKKTLTWEEGDRLEEAPLRMLRGASGMIFHADNDFVFIVFYDDESDDDVFAAAEKVEVQHAQPASSSLRFEAVTFDAEKLLEPVYLGESSCTFAAYNVSTYQSKPPINTSKSPKKTPHTFFDDLEVLVRSTLLYVRIVTCTGTIRWSTYKGTSIRVADQTEGQQGDGQRHDDSLRCI